MKISKILKYLFRFNAAGCKIKIIKKKLPLVEKPFTFNKLLFYI